MSHWLPWFRTRLTAPAADELMRSVCERSTEEIEARLGLELAEMSAAELRGYIRARAIAIVRAHVRNVAEEHALTFRQGEKLAKQSLERVVQLVAKQCASRRRPAFYQVPLRMAG